MTYKSFLLFFIFHITLYTNLSYGQNKLVKTKFLQSDFDKNKIAEETFDLWKYKYLNSAEVKDTLNPSIFVDDRQINSLVNYGVQFKSKDLSVFNIFQHHEKWYLKVDFEKAVFNPRDSIIEIEGYVNGGWGNSNIKKKRKIKIENNIDIFIGVKRDTFVYHYYNKVVNEEKIEVKYKGKDVSNTTVLDTFPAFYFKHSAHYKTASQGKRYFKIQGKVTPNSLLALGDIGCYAEIFDIGSMVYSPKKNKRKKVNKKELPAYKVLIKDNIVLADKDKIKERKQDYYFYTEEAENYIVLRQYAKAKEQYALLNKKYNVIFARDIHNAIRCALFSRDYNNAFLWAEKLANKGISINYFNSKVFISLKKQKQWNRFSITYDSIYNEFQKNRNIKLKSELEKLVDEDQADYGLANRKDSRVLFETTDRVSDKLISLLKEEGYPTEEKIGVYTINDTIMMISPEFHVLFRHAIQKQPKNLEKLEEFLSASEKKLEHDNKRSQIYNFYYNSCFHIYKGNLYHSNSCGINEFAVRKMKFIFNNPHHFFIHTDNYIISEYNKDNPEDFDNYYENNFTYVLKLSDDWEFYDK
ncbi:Hypothetical protein KQS_10705 [Flavobacterium indicum GPTSA100-9 = DSM 17447]|uniref:Uncharacterized protein n=1 Tax=Flavobacterium indicum (strain DSM 17447 / CIP 109464 / GPTSA100-9) TaxID=1094466 RepID=H8XVV3_FLAIG|nr:hypothetical protein [Flavobacterium indicum]CCG54067.1 Hypothetical protein KQS_10705 [Flavobacterium indicum GPTSA100-9 = DSM 17447]